MMSKKRILFVVNPISGNRNKRRFPDLAASVLGTDMSYEIVFTEFVGHATQLATEAVGDYDIVAAVGGDGTLNEVACGLIGSDTPLAIVPSGSGNGLARCLRIPLRADKALRLLSQGSVMSIDTASVNGKPFLSVAGIGLDAQTAYDFAVDPRRGFLTYARYAVRNYLHYKPEKVRITLEGWETVACSPLLVTFANSNQFGYHAIIAPHASLQDGLLDTCALDRPSLLKAPVAVANLMLGQLNKSRLHTDYQAARILVERPAPGVVNVDGEPVMMPETLDIRIVPKSLRVICPDK
ncbi:MAG: diacylglycerol kinase family lipid kinase [Bacteroidales bacterium]|nr:diacylglycerol kinase family lipid kinase [Bacteroidales bacterium]